MVEMNAEYTLLDGIREEFKDAEQPIRMSQEDLLDFFNSLKTNEEILVWYNSGIRSADDWTEMTVGRRSESKKYGVKKVALKGTGGGKFYLYNRKGRISLAMGDMATVLIAAKKREVRNAETFESDQFPSMHYGDHDSDAQEKYQEFLDEWDGDDGPPSFEEWEKQLDEYDRKLQEYQDSAEYAEESFITTDMSPSYIDVVVTDDAGSSFEGRLYGTMKENHSGAKKGLVSYDPSTGNVVYYHKGKEFVGDVENSDMNYNAETFEADSNNCFICSKPANNQRGVNIKTQPSLANKDGDIWLCDEHNNLFDFGLFAKGNLLAWTHPNGTKYMDWKEFGRKLKNAETFDADGRDMTLEEIEETYGEGRLCDHCFDGTFERGTHDDGSTYYRCWKCKQFEAESFGAEWRGRWDVGKERYDGQNDEFKYYIRKMGNNPERFEVFIGGRNPEGRELIRQASKNPMFRNLRDANMIKIGFFIGQQTNWEGKIIKGLYQVNLPKLVEGKRGTQVFSMTPSHMIMDNYGEPVIEGFYRTKQEAINAIYYYFEEMEYPFHISNWPLDMEGWYERYGAETFGVEFNEWADQELMSHGKDISFKDWAEDEGMKHGDVPITDWAQHEEESHDERYEAETDPLWLEKVKHQHYKDMIANLESRNDLTEMDRVRLHHYKDMVKINADEYGAEDNTESIKSAIRKLEKALGKMDGATYKMHDLDISAQPTTIAGFEMSRNGEKYDGGSYLIMTDGSIVNAAMGNADYGNITDNFEGMNEKIMQSFGAESIVKKYGMIAAGVITAFALLPEIKKRF